MNTPILLICFNRPDRVRTALTEIRKQQPKQLFVAQDGPRKDRLEDVIRCKEVQQVVREMINWPCELLTNYQKVNLGCGRGPVAAMNWFFENVEYGIILEDDINPHPLFWNYMEELLVRYKDDNRIGMVCGHNLQRAYYGNASYHFTNAMAGTLGWGTWRRVWKDFRWDIPFDANVLDKALKTYYHIPKVLRDRTVERFGKWMGASRHDSWDYQWDYYLLIHGYLNARANSCLTSHEGNDGDGTHTYFNPNYLMEVNERLFKKIIHPNQVKVCFTIRVNTYIWAIRAFVGKLVKK